VSVKADILLALRGDRPRRVPWNIHHDLLPQGSLERALRTRGLGIIEKSVIPYQTASSHVAVEQRVSWEEGTKALSLTYRTPIGELRSMHVVGPDGSTWVREYPVKGPGDLAVLTYIVEDTEYRPNAEAVRTRQRSLAEDGLVLCRLMRSPLQRLLVEWMGTEGVIYGLADYPKPMDCLLARMAATDEPAFRLAADSPAEAVWSAENITATITSPALFRRYCLPYYNHGASILHAAGKLYGVHMDGKLSALRQAIAESHLDFIEGFTPLPMGDLSLSNARRAWPGKALWVNFPGSVLHGSKTEVLRFTRKLVEEGMQAGGFLLSFMEEFPQPERSLTLVAEAIRRYEKERVL
jgi:hypothetical protein